MILNRQANFVLKDLGELNYFLGIEVTRNKTCLQLSQSKYIVDLLNKHEMITCNLVPTPMITSHSLVKNSGAIISNAFQYRSVVGAL